MTRVSFVAEGHIIWQEDGNFHTLEICNASHSDASVYSACAVNAHGSILCSSRLIVDTGLRWVVKGGGGKWTIYSFLVRFCLWRLLRSGPFSSMVADCFIMIYKKKQGSGVPFCVTERKKCSGNVIYILKDVGHFRSFFILLKLRSCFFYWKLCF